MLQASEEVFQHLQNIVDFGKNVMKEFLGENYVHCGVSGFIYGVLSSWARSVLIIPASQLQFGTMSLIVPHVRVSEWFVFRICCVVR